jgi:hypothetical protein
MAAAEMYNYLENAVPDYAAVTLTLSPDEVVREVGKKNVEIHEGDDGSEEACVISSDTIFYVYLIFSQLSRADSGTIFDFYHDANKGCGIARSFYWTPPADFDGHTYVVKFRCDLDRFYKNYQTYGFASLILKVIGRKPD